MNYFTWYDTLHKPYFTPPSYVFPIVWTFLYISIILALIFFMKDGFKEGKSMPFYIYLVQMFLNLAWSPVFFGMHKMEYALAIVVLMTALTFIIIVEFYKFSKIASYLMMPYVAWLFFATYLNSAFIWMN